MLRTAALGALGTVVSVLLLAPWSWSLIGADASTLGLRVRPPLSFGDVLRFDVGPARSGWFTLGLIVVAFGAARRSRADRVSCGRRARGC